VAKKLTSEDVLERLSDLFVRRDVPEHIRSDNGKLRDEFLKRESFDTRLEAKVLIERWRQACNTVWPPGAGLFEGDSPT
jgi:hypothetical protein